MAEISSAQMDLLERFTEECIRALQPIQSALASLASKHSTFPPANSTSNFLIPDPVTPTRIYHPEIQSVSTVSLPNSSSVRHHKPAIFPCEHANDDMEGNESVPKGATSESDSEVNHTPVITTPTPDLVTTTKTYHLELESDSSVSVHKVLTKQSIGNTESTTDEHKSVVPTIPKNVEEVRVLHVKERSNEEQGLKEICSSEYTIVNKLSRQNNEVSTESFNTQRKGFVTDVLEQLDDELFAVDIIEFQVLQFCEDSIRNFNPYTDYVVFHKWKDNVGLFFRDFLTKATKRVVNSSLFEDAKGVLEEIIVAGFTPDKVTLNALLDFEKAGTDMSAMRVIEEMRSAACEPHMCTFDALLQLHGHHGKFTALMKVFEEIIHCQCTQDIITWNTLLEVFDQNGMDSVVYGVFKELKIAEFEPERDMFNTSISAYSRGGSFDQAMVISKGMLEVGVIPDLPNYNIVLTMLARGGQWQQAANVLIEMMDGFSVFIKGDIWKVGIQQVHRIDVGDVLNFHKWKDRAVLIGGWLAALVVILNIAMVLSIFWGLLQKGDTGIQSARGRKICSIHHKRDMHYIDAQYCWSFGGISKSSLFVAFLISILENLSRTGSRIWLLSANLSSHSIAGVSSGHGTHVGQHPPIYTSVMGNISGAKRLVQSVRIFSSNAWTRKAQRVSYSSGHTVSYQLKDMLTFSPLAFQFVFSLEFLPWSIKWLYGIISDCFPIKGRKETTYLVFTTMLSLFHWFVLSLSERVRSSTRHIILFLTIQNLGSAMATVVVDTMIAEAARAEWAAIAGDLQSMAFGGICGSLLGRYSVSSLQTETILLIFSLLPTIQLISCGLVIESRVVGAPSAALDSKGSNLLNGHGSGSDEDNVFNEDPSKSMLRRRKGPDLGTNVLPELTGLRQLTEARKALQVLVQWKMWLEEDENELNATDYEQLQNVVHHEDMVSLEGQGNDTARHRARGSKGQGIIHNRMTEQVSQSLGGCNVAQENRRTMADGIKGQTTC